MQDSKQTEEQRIDTKSDPKQSVNLKMIVIIALVAVVAALAGAGLTCLYFINNPVKSTQGSTVVTTTPAPTTTSAANISTNTITGELPVSWKLVEGQPDLNSVPNSIPDDANGMVSLELDHVLADGSVQPVFTLTAIYGIGGMQTCSQIYKFSDTSKAFISAKETINKTTLENYTYSIVDLAAEKYVPIKLFGQDARVVYSKTEVNDIYFNENTTGTKEFNPGCDELDMVRIIPQLSFTHKEYDGNVAVLHQYLVTYNHENITQEDAKTVAQILNSLKLK